MYLLIPARSVTTNATALRAGLTAPVPVSAQHLIVGCPDHMEYVCPVEIINHIHGFTSTKQELDTTTTSTRKPVPTKAPFVNI